MEIFNFTSILNRDNMLIRLNFDMFFRPFRKKVLVPGRHKRVSPPTVTHNRHALFIFHKVVTQLCSALEGTCVTRSFQVVVKSSVLSSSQPINSAPAAIFTSNSSSSSTGSSQTPPNPLQPNNINPGQPPPQNVLGRPGIQLWFCLTF